jgi:hypothetical protein
MTPRKLLRQPKLQQPLGLVLGETPKHLKREPPGLLDSKTLQAFQSVSRGDNLIAQLLPLLVPHLTVRALA